MKYVAYYRVSTDKQGKSKLGLGAQQDIVQNYISNRGELIKEFTEVETGTNKRYRKELSTAIDLCKKNNATLVIAKLDRLARNVSFISSLMDSNVEFIACDLPAANRMTIHILAAVAENEAELISGRTKASLKQIKNKIKKDGFYITKEGNKIETLGSPQNLTKSARMKGVRVRQEKARNNKNTSMARPFAEELRNHGKSYGSISDILNENNYPTARGGKWFPMSVKQLIG